MELALILYILAMPFVILAYAGLKNVLPKNDSTAVVMTILWPLVAIPLWIYALVFIFKKIVNK